MLKKILFAAILLTGMVQARLYAGNGFDILQKAAGNIDIAPSLVMDRGWVRYPSYSDRAGWNALLGEYVPELIGEGEKFLGFEWIVIPEEDYLAYETRGDRYAMEDKHAANCEALSTLFIAELAQGQGRFLPDIVRGVDYFCGMKSWAVSCHLAKYQRCKCPLPDPNENILALFQGNTSQLLSWIYFYLHEAAEAAAPGVFPRLRECLQQRELDPYLQRDDFEWMGWHLRPGKKINNWNPWCNANALLCYMLLEDDRETLAKAVEKAIASLDLYIDALPTDGACDEGTTYWYKSTGHLLDCLECLEMVTGGRIRVWDDPLIRRLGEYILNADIGNDWQVNFADGGPSRKPIAWTVYRYGKASGNTRMVDFAVNSHKAHGCPMPSVDWTLFYQSLEGTLASLEMKSLEDREYSPAAFVTYPQTQTCFLRAGKSFLAVKGGNNNERHNHNDVGNCIYFHNGRPVFVDAGVGTYTKDTFGEGRWGNWFVQSGWHNIPSINGCDQPNGEEYAASGFSVSRLLRRVRVDIAGAYPDSAFVKSWKLSYRLKRDGSLVIAGKFSLSQASQANVLHFLVRGKPSVVEEGRIALADGLCLNYDPGQFEAAVEGKSLTGLGFNRRWGGSLYRISLTAKSLQKKGKYVLRAAPDRRESIPDIARSVAERAKAQFSLMDARLGDAEMPRTLYPDGSVKNCGLGSWNSGFFPGSLWLLYEMTGDVSIKALAEKQTAKMSNILDFPLSHDIGFQVNCSYGNAYRITGEERYLPLLRDAADALEGRFNPKVGATVSWSPGERGTYPVIIDNMMNLELLEYAATLFGDARLDSIAVVHAETTMKNHFRPDNSTWHLVDYDPSTGNVLRKVTVQGYSDDSAWSRGQAWALYGYTMMFRETGREEFLTQAEAVARMLLDRLPEDGIPYWDFDDPSVPDCLRDASAGAVMCSAFIELSTLTSDNYLKDMCLSVAETQIRTLASPEYLAAPGENGNFLLAHSVGNLPSDTEVDVPLTYADYYYIEALNRYLSL